jgi:mttA/Hcf106 family
MLDLSPTKMFIILIVAVIVVGPRRLPRVAREFAKGWRRLRELYAQIDREVRQSIPGIPPDLDILRHARSPVALLNKFVDAVPEQADPTPEKDPTARAPRDARPNRFEVAPFDAMRCDVGDVHASSTEASGAPAVTTTWHVPAVVGSNDDPSMN